jgi:hypothetical protein
MVDEPAQVVMTQEQLNQILQAVGAAGGGGGGAGAGAIGSAVAVGQLGSCELGRDRTKRFKKFNDWIKQAESKLAFLGITDDQQKVNYVKSCAGPDLITFWEKEARVRFAAVEANPALNIVAEAAHTYIQIIEESKKVLLAIINRDRAVIDLLRISQGDRSVMEFLAEIEDQARLCRANERRIMEDDLVRMALVAGFKDRLLAEKVLAEEHDLKTTIQLAVTRENSKANVAAMQGKQSERVMRMKEETIARMRPCSESDMKIMEEEEGDIARLEERLAVLKVKQYGKFSGRFKPKEDAQPSGQKCRSCSLSHMPGECPAKGKECYRCEGRDHYARAAVCPGPKSGRQPARNRRVEEDEGSDSSKGEWEEENGVVKKVQQTKRRWPGVKEGAPHGRLHMVNPKEKIRRSKWVSVRLGGHRVRLFADTGCRYSIISPDMYKERMGVIVPARRALRAWGADTDLNVKGMFKTEVSTERGARSTTWVYVVEGHRPEPLLGEKDAEALGIIVFHAEGRMPNESETCGRSQEDRGVRSVKAGSIPGKLREAGINVKTEKSQPVQIKEEDKAKAWKIVEGFKSSVFRPGIGLIKTSPIKLEHEEGFKPVQPPRRGVPYHYQERLSQHLALLRKEGAMEEVDPREPIDAVMNVVITEKKQEGQIRMNLDATPLNKGALMTKYHVKTAAEVRHDLEGAAFFSELDMGYGYHQLQLHPDTAKMAVFQTHEGLHRMKRLFFGPKAATGIFHNEVQKSFRGVEGVTTIHDNILVYGHTVEEHNVNLFNCLTRAKERGVRLKLEKSTILEPEVSWFGRIFSGTGVSADPKKIKNILDAGRPESTEDVRSLIQACSYNAKFSFDHNNKLTYSEVTAPLRELLGKDEIFRWTEERENSYVTLINIMSDKTTLRPFNKNRPTHFVSDASPKGIAASVYQEEEDGTWIPIDHIDRALSKVEQGWASQIEWECLGQCWGMLMLRSYLIGSNFTSWCDHRPLIPLLNNLAMQASVRINALRHKIQDLTFNMKYLKGKENPCDYKSRHCTDISDLKPDQREKLHVNDNNDIVVMRILLDDVPPALTSKMIKEAVKTDVTYQNLVTAVQAGPKPTDPDLGAYTAVWSELAVVDGLVLRGDRIIIPDGQLENDEGNMRQWVVELGHEGHMGTNAIKRLLRTRVWFPGMDKMVEQRTEECLECQASVKTPSRDPLQPTQAPELPFDRCAADHWGPTPDGKYVLVLIDLLTRFPEVEVVEGTSAEQNIHALDSIFARHSIPKVLLTDGGPPWNTSPEHPLQRYFTSMGVNHRTTISAEDPEANGTCEAWMKHLKKVWHTSLAQYKDPVLELNKHLRSVRATPHPTTGASPAELLYNRSFRTKLPDLRTDPARGRADIIKAQVKDREEKEKMKMYKDRSRYVKAHDIKLGDLVLKERRSTKQDSPYDPKPYKVTEVIGTQIKGQRDEEEKTRDSQKWKVVKPARRRRFRLPTPEVEEDADIGPPRRTAAVQPPRADHQVQDDVHPVEQEYPDRQDIQARLRGNRDVILADTVANRPARTRTPRVMYQAKSQLRDRTRK